MVEKRPFSGVTLPAVNTSDVVSGEVWIAVSVFLIAIAVIAVAVLAVSVGRVLSISLRVAQSEGRKGVAKPRVTASFYTCIALTVVAVALWITGDRTPLSIAAAIASAIGALVAAFVTVTVVNGLSGPAVDTGVQPGMGNKGE